MPLVLAPTYYGEKLVISFAEELLRMVASDYRQLAKPLEVMVKYGYRGASRGGKSGIFLLHERDAEMLQKTRKLFLNHRDSILEDFSVRGRSIRWNDVDPVKVVWPESSGTRLVGVFCSEASYDPRYPDAIILLGWATYDKQ